VITAALQQKLSGMQVSLIKQGKKVDESEFSSEEVFEMVFEKECTRYRQIDCLEC